jgi:ribokinase
MIVVFGSINVDLITPVARLPARGETVVGGDYTLVQGGKGANQALAAALGAAAGQRVAMVGTTGSDAWGGVALERLREGGVDLSAVVVGRGHTACGFISVDREGQTLITVSPGANMETRAALLDRLAPPLAKGDWLVLQMEVALEENWRALARAKAVGARVALNLAPAMPVDAAVLGQLDLLVVNEVEAAFVGAAQGLGTEDPVAIAQALALRHALTCVVTLGESGSIAVEPGGRGWRAGCPAVSAVDTTGAGDAYVGYLVAALDRGAVLSDAMRFASTGASLSCAVRGAQSAYQPREAIERRVGEAVVSAIGLG